VKRRLRGEGVVRRTVLPGGLRLVTEAMPTVRSAAFGIWVGVGSRDEAPTLAGASHYLEHLLFKGTRRRSALEISSAIDAVGGEMNAFTSKEYTCFYARVLDEDLPLATDVVCDLVTSSVVRAADVDSERGVVLEEIAMQLDDPTDVVHELFATTLFGDTPLGRPVLGTAASITAMSRAAVAGYYRRRYRPQDMVVAVAGNLDHDRVVRDVQTAFTSAGMLGGDNEPSPPRAGSAVRRPRRPRRPRTGESGSIDVVRRPGEQANVVLGVPGVSRSDERRFALGVLNSALGGGMSSRLFQQVREKRGLAYSVYSYAEQYADTGLLGIYAGCQPRRTDEVIKLCRDELAAVAEHGIGADELARGKGQLRGSLVLGLEDTGSRMSRIGKSELMHGDLLTVGDILGRIASVTLDDVRAVAADVLTAAPSLAVVGPFARDRDFAGAVA
jgi:predicted Zn-dependent peptidase